MGGKREIRAGDTMLAVEERGDASGCPVIFVHAFPLSRAMWAPQLDALPKGIRAIAYDVRGFGESPPGATPPTIELFADDLLGLLDALKLDRAVLCGLSMGGYIVLRAAERAPERLRGLVLCDTQSPADADAVKVKRAGAIRSLLEGGLEAFADGFCRNVLAAETVRGAPEIVEYVKGLIRANDPGAIARTLVALAARTDTTAALARFDVPALVLAGEHDPLTGPEKGRAMAARLPQGRFEEIAGAGHLANLERPAEFNRRLFEFLESLR